jgi:preprotein translocase subunit SecG
MHTLIIVIHVLAALAVIGLVLVQHGKGADMGAAFGSGASQTLFGSRGSATFLTRLTAGLAATFFVTSLALGYLGGQPSKPSSVVAPGSVVVPAPTQEGVPAVPTAPEVPK